MLQCSRMKINNLFQVWEYWQNSAVINGSKLFWGSVVDEKNVLQLIFVPLKWDNAMVLRQCRKHREGRENH